MNSIEAKYLNKLVSHYSLTVEESEELMEKFLSGNFNPKLAASILSIISFKGENVEEITGFAQALIKEMKKFNTSYENLIDIVGAGGDDKNTFNISTVSSLIMSILGVKVAKEIRHCLPTYCGSADFLEALGVNINASYEQKKQCLEEENYVFINISDYYPAIEPIKKIEQEMGFLTTLSLLPPLCHPAKVRRIIVGTTDRLKASLMAQALEIIGIDKAYILWNEEGYDEVVPIGVTKVIVIERDKEKRELSLTANDFALAGNYKVGTPVPGGSKEINVGIVDEIDSCTPGIVFDTVVMNTVLGLRLSGTVNSLKEGTELVKNKFKKGMLKNKIQNLVQITNSS